MRKLFLAVLVPLLLSTNVSAQACDERKRVLDNLFRSYSEIVVAQGLAANGNMFEVLSSENGETWTVISTSPNGISCLLAAGEDWEGYKYDATNSGQAL